MVLASWGRMCLSRPQRSVAEVGTAWFDFHCLCFCLDACLCMGSVLCLARMSRALSAAVLWKAASWSSLVSTCSHCSSGHLQGYHAAWLKSAKLLLSSANERQELSYASLRCFLKHEQQTRASCWPNLNKHLRARHGFRCL